MTTNAIVTTPAIQRLATARAAVVKAAAAAQAAHDAHSNLLVKLADAQARADESLSDFRSGKIDEATSALRKAIADADAKDLQKMINDSAENLAQLNDASNGAMLAEANAKVAELYEQRVEEGSRLEAIISEIESKLLDAVVERYRVQAEIDPDSLKWMKIYKPSPALDELVRRGRVPGF
ncbi:hypothetical protein AB4Y45_27960 [Paraburkholderia sp. EG287A]|uniref:hypothetical protein n=1 Tax=Paraburkholderia sp. EG287A TaxID=3237012 RepID=UPI0034D2408D